jgi:hypothetical protein
LLWAFELDLFRALGFDLQWTTDIRNGMPLTPPFAGPVRYRLSDGSFLHPDNRADFPFDGSLSAEAFTVLSRLAQMNLDFISKLSLGLRTHRELALFLSRYLETHLPVKGRLRSLEALRWEGGSSASD